MPDLAVTLYWLPLTLGPVLLVLVAPTAATQTRGRFAIALFALCAVAFAYAILQAGAERELRVVNPFLDPDQGEPLPFVTDTVTAGGWAWPLAAAIALFVPGALLWSRSGQPGSHPCPVTFGSIVTVWTLATRLALEKTAAPDTLTWATGVTFPMLLMVPFVGWWAGARGASFKKFLLMLLLLGIAQRAMIVGVGFVATTMGLGTHLDVSPIREVTLLVGHRDFTGPGDQTVRQWVTLLLVPQFMLWVPFTVVAGAILGTLPYLTARRRHKL